MIDLVFRNLAYTDFTADILGWLTRADARGNAALNSSLGQLVVDTADGDYAADVLTCTMLFPQGFTAIQPGAFGWLVLEDDIIGPTQLVLPTVGTVALKSSTGLALVAGDYSAADLLGVVYDGREGHGYFRVLATAPRATPVTVLAAAGAKLLTATGTWTAPYNCYVDIYLCGGAGSGARVTDDDGTARATGGGGGEIRIKRRLYMTAGQTLYFTAGDGGAAMSFAGGDDDGNDGAASSVTGPDSFSMIANGGEGGNQAKSGTVPGADGGTGGSGGDEAWPGTASPAASSGDPRPTCGGTFGLSASPPTPAANTEVATDALDQISPFLGAFKWAVRGSFLGSAGNETQFTSSADGSPGCGSGAGAVAADTDIGVGKGGDGFMYVEHSPEV